MADPEILRLERAEAACDRGDFAAALREIMPLAEKGSSNAQTFLGVLYEQGKGLKKDPAKAIEWYRRAAEQGNSAAQFNIGILYETGSGVARRPSEAAK